MSLTKVKIRRARRKRRALSYRKLVGCLGIAPSSRRLRAGTSLSKFATHANAKAELNRRSQICEALTGTGVRVAKRIPKRTESVTRPELLDNDVLVRYEGEEVVGMTIMNASKKTQK